MIKTGLKIGAILLIVSTSIQAVKPVSLHSDFIKYKENKRVLVASSNVHLIYEDIEITAPKLNLDIDNNYVWGTGNIIVKRGEDEFNTSAIMMDLNKESITLKNIRMTILPPEEKGRLYLKSHSLTDTPDFKVGSKGFLTTCDKPNHHHHYVWAQKFKYYPDKKITMYNVVFYNKLLFIPVYFWTPYYRYSLGKRKVVWNFPTIGEKKAQGWGLFLQNSIDYKHADRKDSSIFFDWFQDKEDKEGKIKLGQGSLGLGIRHHYKAKNNDGMLYYYSYDFSKKENDKKVDKFNKQIAWENTFKPNDIWSLEHSYKTTDIAQKINSTGSQKNDYKSLNLTYNDLGNYYNWKTTESQNFNQKSDSLKNSYTRKVNKNKILDLSHNKLLTYSNSRKKETINGTHHYYFKNNATLTSKATYSEIDTWTDNLGADKHLEAFTSYKKELSSKLDFTLNVDHFKDLDSVTSDIKNNNFFYKEPELIFNFKNLTWKKITFTQSSTIARYKETRWSQKSKKQRLFPDTGDYTIEPNTYIFKQKGSRVFSDKSMFNQTLELSSSYDQYIFNLANTDLTKGDALYSLDFSATYTTDTLEFIKTSTTYKNAFIHKDANSPFYKFQKDSLEENHIAQALTLYKTVKKMPIIPIYFNIEWRNKTTYNWIKTHERWGIYDTSLDLDITHKVSLSASTGKRLNFMDYNKDSRFNDLIINLNINPTKEYKLKYFIIYDMNKWRDEKETHINNSNFTLDFKLGRNPNYAWHIRTLYRYDTSNQTGVFEKRRYEMQSFNITKKEHKRELNIEYVFKTNELKIMYTFNAFPDDPLKLRKRDEVWKVEGRFSQQSEERFK